MQLVMATTNSHKLDEIRTMSPGLKIVGLGDLDCPPGYEETGATFFDNAIGKAHHYSMLTGRSVLADDSGLCCYALNGEPGVRSARYGEAEGRKGLNDAGRCELLLSKLEGAENRQAEFVCCLVLYSTMHRYVAVHESCPGEIVTRAKGDHGFGYDPIFKPTGFNRTMAELQPEEKNHISHRARALSVLAPTLSLLLADN